MNEEMTVCILTADKYLMQKIKLELGEDVTVRDTVTEDAVIIVDIDSCDRPSLPHLTISRKSPADVRLPLPIGELKALILARKKPTSSITLDALCKTALLLGEEIKLTDVEYTLLSLLVEKKGEYASREEILERVWANECDPGIINVYVHYLRGKLERHGEKIILSSRLHGYKIDEKYLKETKTGGKDA